MTSYSEKKVITLVALACTLLVLLTVCLMILLQQYDGFLQPASPEADASQPDGYADGVWFELYNSGDETRDLSGCRLADGAYTFPAGTVVGPGETIMVQG